jgi:hypothetical protein
MRLLPVIGAIALASLLMCAHPASAFMIYSGGGTGGSSRYADPDDQIRSYFGLGGGHRARLELRPQDAARAERDC